MVPFVLVFGISYFFTEFGPNTTTFIYPAEIFPTEVRTTAHGISAGMGKMGAFVGVYLLTDNLNAWGIRTVEGVCAAVALAGLLLTVACLPEPAGKSLGGPGSRSERGLQTGRSCARRHLGSAQI